MGQPIQLTTLPNGLHIITQRTTGFEECVAFQIRVLTGSNHEEPKEKGLAHFLEHLLCYGSKETISQHGSIPNAFINAYYHRGNYNASTSLTDTIYAGASDRSTKVTKTDFEYFFRLINEGLVAPGFEAKETEIEREIVVREIGERMMTPWRKQVDIAFNELYNFPPHYGNTSGTEQTVSSITQEQLLTFAKNNYIPERIIISAAGDVDHDQICALSDSIWGNAENGASARLLKPSVFTPLTRKILREDTPTYGFSFIMECTPRIAPNGGASYLFGQLLQEHLHNSMREEKQTVYSVNLTERLVGDIGSYEIGFSGNDHSFTPALGAMYDSLLSFPDSLTENALNRFIKAGEKSALLFGKDPSDLASVNSRKAVQQNPPLTTTEWTESLKQFSVKDILNEYEKSLTGLHSVIAAAPSETLKIIPTADEVSEQLRTSRTGRTMRSPVGNQGLQRHTCG